MNEFNFMALSHSPEIAELRQKGLLSDHIDSLQSKLCDPNIEWDATQAIRGELKGIAAVFGEIERRAEAEAAPPVEGSPEKVRHFQETSGYRSLARGRRRSA